MVKHSPVELGNAIRKGLSRSASSWYPALSKTACSIQALLSIDGKQYAVVLKPVYNCPTAGLFKGLWFLNKRTLRFRRRRLPTTVMYFEMTQEVAVDRYIYYTDNPDRLACSVGENADILDFSCKMVRLYRKRLGLFWLRDKNLERRTDLRLSYEMMERIKKLDSIA